MRVAFGLSVHSGWAALVVIGEAGRDLVVVDRRRIDLVEEQWAKQPYHSAVTLNPDAARDRAMLGIESADRIALAELQAASMRERQRHNEVKACVVLAGSPMPDWSVADILAVHFRMHKAEGALFRTALVRAANACGLHLLEIGGDVQDWLVDPKRSRLRESVAMLGKQVGAPWGKDQKDAALAAVIGLQESVDHAHSTG